MLIKYPKHFDTDLLLGFAKTFIPRQPHLDSARAGPSELDSVPSTKAAPQSDASSCQNVPAEAGRMLLALCGWQQETPDIISCRDCFRRLGLWLYRQTPGKSLDPLEEHRTYCPWVSSSSQDGCSSTVPLQGLAGWQIMLRHAQHCEAAAKECHLEPSASRHSLPSMDETRAKLSRLKRIWSKK